MKFRIILKQVIFALIVAAVVFYVGLCNGSENETNDVNEIIVIREK